MNEYYGIASTPTEDFLAHYGIKGMKWGVRKAIADGNGRRLDRHYRKAARKLRTLEWKANPKEQMKLAKTNDKVAKVGFKVGLAGIGTAVGANIAGRALTNAYRKAHDAFYYPGYDLDAIKRVKAFESGNKDLYDQMQNKRYDEWNRYKTASDNHTKYGNAAGKVEDIARRVGAIGLGIGVGSKIVSANAKWRATKGNAKMKQNRDAWKKEMRKAFKNTKYQNLPSYESLHNKKKTTDSNVKSNKKTSYKELVETFDREEKKDHAMYKDLINRPFGKTRIKKNIGKKAHEFKAQETRIHDLANEIHKRQKQGRAKLPKR